MHPARHLSVLRDRACHRVDYLSALSVACSQPTTDCMRRRAAFVLVEGVNTWSAFVRSFYLSCVFRAQRERRGRVAVGIPGIVTADQAIEFAVLKVAKGKQKARYSWSDEPAWHKRETIAKLSTLLALSNDAEIQVAVNVGTKAFVDIVTCRNFFAHRGKATMAQARSTLAGYGQSLRDHPSNAVCGTNPGRTQNIMTDWLSDIRLTMELLCD
jgi:hypothetical protein